MTELISNEELIRKNMFEKTGDERDNAKQAKQRKKSKN